MSRIYFYSDGHDYQENYINTIESAQEEIVLQTYIFQMDNFGTRVFEALKEALRRQVKVSLLLDSIGSAEFPQDLRESFQNEGGLLEFFNSIKWKNVRHWGRRLHHKVLLVDRRKAFVGGINVIDCFDEGFDRPRLDFAVLIDNHDFTFLYHYCHDLVLNKRSKKFMKESSHENFSLSVNDWIYNRWSISQDYKRMLENAQSSVDIINSYFFPRWKFLKKLAQAAKRGVRVRLFLPRYSDWQSHVYASEFFYSYLLKNGVEIYQWKCSVVHGKMAVIDKKLCSVGSFNLHYTSYQGNLEMNVNFKEEEAMKEVNYFVHTTLMMNSEKVSFNSLREFSWIRKLQQLFYYVIVSTVSSFSLGFTHQEEVDKLSEKRTPYFVFRTFFSLILFFLGILGIVLPVIPGIPLLILSFFTIYPQVLLNRKNLD